MSVERGAEDADDPPRLTLPPAERRRARRVSWRLPPVWVRRCVIAPLVVLAAFVWLPTAVWLGVVVAGVVAWALPGRVRILRVLFMVGLYLLWDAMALVWMLGLWIASGFGWKVRGPRFQAEHYRLAGVMLRSLFAWSRRILRLTIDFQDADLDALAPGRPIIVVSRHAGPGDSFIIVEALITRFSREPAIVLKDTLQWDPAIDVLLNRLPTRFVTPVRHRRPGAAGGSESVGELAAGLDDNDALLIFPEGANATPKRRERRIAQLREAGHDALAARAETMPHVMPPHAGGVLAAMEACPEAAVVVVAHTGLEALSTVRDVWRELPVDKRIVLKGWTAQPDEIPAGSVFQVAWEGPNNHNDYITIVEAGAPEGTYDNYTRTRNGNPLEVTAPDGLGNYEVRYVIAQSGRTLVSQPVTLTPVTAQLIVNGPVPPGTDFEVQWVGPDNHNDYITIVEPGAPEGTYTDYARTRTGSVVTIEAPAEEGEYEVRYVMAQSGRTVASVPVTVGVEGISLESAPTVAAGGVVEVTWTGPGRYEDFIEIVPAGSGPEVEALRGTRASQGSPLQIFAPAQAGQYEIRYRLSDTDEVLATIPLTVE